MLPRVSRASLRVSRSAEPRCTKGVKKDHSGARVCVIQGKVLASQEPSILVTISPPGQKSPESDVLHVGANAFLLALKKVGLSPGKLPGFNWLDPKKKIAATFDIPRFITVATEDVKSKIAQAIRPLAEYFRVRQ